MLGIYCEFDYQNEKMKKVLFLSFNYPEGEYGPSTMCSVRIMEEMIRSGLFEVHCVSHREGKNNYNKNQNIIIHYLGIKPDRKKHSRNYIHLRQVLLIPFFPFYHLISDFRYYRECKKIVQNNQFDLIVSQHLSEQSLMSGVLLKKGGYATKHIALFWDNIYGKFPKVLPKSFVLRRQRRAENFIAKYTDTLISLYPLKPFHDEYGDVSNAKGKRKYLGIPSIVRPKNSEESSYKSIILSNKINIIYSGTIFKKEYVEYTASLFNHSMFSKDCNMIFFSRSVADKVYENLNSSFDGIIQYPGFIPHSELMALYSKVDFFISFPGIVTAIRSKVYEYMSYGKPILLFYEDENDVNISTFSKYPYCISIDTRLTVEENVTRLDSFIESTKGKIVQYEMVENLFPLDTVSAYVDLLKSIC